uniref:Phosphoglycerate kinase n=1 Tax=Trypanosoma vivax (strain Y486) TaxID=1055687 RepID=G0UAC1_TRYVY|nr:putative phosphoglycerate kinase [Trypanosoma vivax Y486]
MSVGALRMKRRVPDVWPVRNKRFFLLVSPENIVGETTDALTTISTISYLLEREGAVVVAASFGPLKGIPMNASLLQRDELIEAFRAEGGMGYTNFFFSLSTHHRAEVLKALEEGGSVPGDAVLGGVDTARVFARLPTREKAEALHRVFPKMEFSPVSTHVLVNELSKRFPNIAVKFAPDSLRAPVHSLAPGEILVLENLQFYRNESSPSLMEQMAMAEVLAANIDVFINESFATVSARHASNTALPKILLHGAAGFSMDRELAFFSSFLTHPPRPIAVVVAGDRIPEKLRMVRSLVGKVDKILIAGALVMPFLAAKGLSVDKSFQNSEQVRRRRLDCNGEVEELSIPSANFAEEIIALCNTNGVELVLPVDHVVTKQLTQATENSAVIIESVAVPSDVYAVDCGIKTISLFAKHISECQCVFWTGAFGCTCIGYSEGTYAFARALAEARKLSIISGNRTIRAIQDLGISLRFSHISSGGVACLEVLQGHLLPGVEALSEAQVPLDFVSAASADELLRRLPLFSGCSPEQVRAVAKKCTRCAHARGDYLAYRGDRHVSMWVVARGGLVARAGDNTVTIPCRYIGPGQTVGMYDFITQSLAVETVQAAVEDTITYQLTSSSLHDLLAEHTDIAAQLLQNASETLRLMANDEYLGQGAVLSMLKRAATRTRTPFICPVERGCGFIDDVVQDVASVLVFEGPALQCAVSTVRCFCRNERCEPCDFVAASRLALSVGGAIVRDIVYHSLVRFGLLTAIFVSSITASPFALLAAWTTLGKMSYTAFLNVAITSTVSGYALW